MLRKDLPIRTDLTDAVGGGGIPTITVYANPIVSPVRTNLGGGLGGEVIVPPSRGNSPLFIDNCIFFFNADSYAVNSYPDVLYDLSFTGNNFSQTNPLFRAQILANQFGGRNGLVFDGLNDRYDSAVGDLIGLNPAGSFTIVGKYKTGDGGGSNASRMVLGNFALNSSGTPNRCYALFANNTASNLFHGIGNTVGTGSIAKTPTEYHNYAIVKNGSTGLTEYKNAVAGSTITGYTVGSTFYAFSIGALRTGVGAGTYSDFLNGTIISLAVYSRALTSSELLDLNDWL